MKRPSHPTNDTITEDQRRFCADGLYGQPEVDPFPYYRLGGSYPEVPGIWQQCREQILADWIVEHPCNRPRLWWQFDAPDDLRKEHYIPGNPNSMVLREESSAAFLKRHNFLSDSEQEFLNQRPELLEDEFHGR